MLPDIVCLGKALGGGLPISACAGREAVMRTWPASRGEALHTSTHLGNPMGCAAALAVIAVIETDGLIERARVEGERWLDEMRGELSSCACVRDVRGKGLLIGVELDDPRRAGRAVRDLLGSGWITLGEGPSGNVLALAPPLNIPRALLDAATLALGKVLR